MNSSLTGLRDEAKNKLKFESYFLDTQRIFYCSETKQAPLSKTPVTLLGAYEFFRPNDFFCRYLVVDIDNVLAHQYITDLPAAIKPHAVVETSKGVQAFWLIEGVPLGERMRQEPIRFAQDVGELLRLACGGDSAVDPVTPSKCRNPLYLDADVYYPAECPAYKLRELKAGLKAFGVSKSRPAPAKEPQTVIWGELVEGQRNETIFNTIRQVAYRGGDYESLAYELNQMCNPPLPDSEVAGIVRSVQKFMATKYTGKKKSGTGEQTPEALREFMREIGRKGGSTKTEKKLAQEKAFVAAGTTVRVAQSIGRKAQIQALKKAGYKQREVAEQMGISIETVKRGWRAP